MRRLAVTLAFALLSASPATAACRQALALGLDISGSVDAAEYALQREGLAAALSSEEVRAVLLAEPEAPVRIAVFEWSGPRDQHLILDWTAIEDEAALSAVVARLLTAPRVTAAPSTAIGSAVLFGGALLAEQESCWRKVLDLSGDGPANTGPRPQDISSAELPGAMTVNGLAILTEDARRGTRDSDLADYFRTRVIRGPAAFVEVAEGYEDYAAAMRRKLLRELQSLMLGGLAPLQ